MQRVHSSVAFTTVHSCV